MSPLQAAAVRVDITPGDLTGLNPMGGGTFTGVHDPIFGRVLYLSDGERELVWLAVDLIEVGDMTGFRARLETELGVPAAHVVITASHDHSAPRLGDVSPGALAHGGGPEQKAYSLWVYDQLVTAVSQAKERLRPAKLGFDTGVVDVNINRDVPGDGRWELGLNPERVSDKTVAVLRIEDEVGQVVAVWFSYGVHSTVTLWTGPISGDLAGAAARRVEAALGGVALFAPGLLGDQAPRVLYEHASAAEKADPEFAFRAADEQGAMLGDEVVRVAQSLDSLRGDMTIWAGDAVVACPSKPGEDVDPDMRQEAVATVDLRVSLFRLGGVSVFGFNGELVTAHGWTLRSSLPAPAVLVSLANDRIGYLADDEGFRLGTFEARGCPVPRGCLELTAARMLDDLVGRASNAL